MPDTSHPPYSGPAVRCTKCGNKGAHTSYMAYGRCTHAWPYEVIGSEPNERLHRECERCGHQWDENTIEAKEPPR